MLELKYKEIVSSVFQYKEESKASNSIWRRELCQYYSTKKKVMPVLQYKKVSNAGIEVLRNSKVSVSI